MHAAGALHAPMVWLRSTAAIFGNGSMEFLDRVRISPGLVVTSILALALLLNVEAGVHWQDDTYQELGRRRLP